MIVVADGETLYDIADWRQRKNTRVLVTTTFLYSVVHCFRLPTPKTGGLRSTKMNNKKCSTCRLDKPRTEFNFDKSRKDGHTHRCKPCARLRNRKYKGMYRNKDRNRVLNWKYKGIILSIAGYDQMLIDQDGRCAICSRHHSEFSKKLAVDHDHATGKIRGLLCSNCNTGIGKLGDNAERVRSAMEYLLVNS